jgi:four helix bundle protein
MLRVQVIVLDMLKLLRPVLTAIGRRDRSLEDQLRRAATSVVLNLAEGVGSHAGNKKARYQTALGSLNEVDMALQAAIALGYVDSLDGALTQAIVDAGRMLASLASR